MNEIKVGEYIRTNIGDIGKIKRIEIDEIDKSLKWYVFDKKRPNMNIVDEIYTNKPYITKHSKKIINLIDVGDFVNGYTIITVNYEEQYITTLFVNNFGEKAIKVLQDIDIKTILTKEQYNQNCYRLEE